MDERTAQTDPPAQVLPFAPRLARVSPPRWAMAAILMIGLGLGFAGQRFLEAPAEVAYVAGSATPPASAPPASAPPAVAQLPDRADVGEASREAASPVGERAARQLQPAPAGGASSAAPRAGGHATRLALRDGHGVFGIEPDATPSGVARSVDPTVVSMVADGAATGALPLPASFGRVQSRAGRPMGAAQHQHRPTPVSPRSTFVRDGQPRFTWEALADATSYEVVVIDEDLAVVAVSGDVRATTWTPDAPLARGVVLTWQVTALTPSGRVTAPQPPDAEARFQVMTTVAADALVADLARCGESRIARAFVLARAGLIADATPLFEDVAAQNPGDAVARRWLQAARANQGP